MTAVQQPEPTRVLHVVGRLSFGGVEHWLRDVVRAVDPNRFRLDFVVQDETVGCYEQELAELGATIHRVPSHRRPMAYAVGLFRVLTAEVPYDVVHCHQNWFSAFPLLVAWAARVPIRVCHSHTAGIEARDAGSIPRLIYGWIARGLARLAATDLVAGNQESGVMLFGKPRAWRRGFEVVRCGIPLAPYHPDRRNTALAAELGIDPKAFVIAQVGRLVPVKNHALTIASMVHVARLMPDAVCLIVGQGPLRADLESRIDSAGLGGRVLMVGARGDDDVPRIMSGLADVVVIPSLYEGLPIVALEAQAAGRQLLMSDAVTREGDVVESLIVRLPIGASARQWAEAVVRARESGPTAEARLRAHTAMAQSEFALERSIEQLERVYARSK